MRLGTRQRCARYQSKGDRNTTAVIIRPMAYKAPLKLNGWWQGIGIDVQNVMESEIVRRRSITFSMAQKRRYLREKITGMPGVTIHLRGKPAVLLEVR